jgi:hypothetical protein
VDEDPLRPADLGRGARKVFGANLGLDASDCLLGGFGARLAELLEVPRVFGAGGLFGGTGQRRHAEGKDQAGENDVDVAHQPTASGTWDA